MTKGKKIALITTSSILGVLVILTSTFFIYTGIYYHTDKEKVDAYMSKKSVTVTEVDGSTLMFESPNSKKGIVFYPGAKVEYTAYEPLMASMCENGYTCFLVKMPFIMKTLQIPFIKAI